MNGVDALLEGVAMYKSKDPKTPDEEEMLENLFDSLCCLLMPLENKERFVNGEGVELMIIIMKQKNYAYGSAIRALDFAMTNYPPASERFVDVMGLKTTFAAIMGKASLSIPFLSIFTISLVAYLHRERYKEELEERVISLIASLFAGVLSGSRRDRLLSKFVENEYEKIDRLMELYIRHSGMRAWIELLLKQQKLSKKDVKEILQMKKYGLQIRARSQKKKSSGRPPLRPASIFYEDEDNDVEKEISRQASKTKSLKETEEQHKKALEEDPCAFAYDEVYDDMKQGAVVPKMKMRDRQERKPRYVQHLVKKAEQRQKEHEIVYERKLAKEREKDEHLFSGKEKFITDSHKRKLVEQKKWLAEERLRELQEERDDVTKKSDLSDFYFNIGKNVAFGARDIEAKEAETLEEQRKAEKLDELRKDETREEKKADLPDQELLPESEDIGSRRKKSVEPQEEEQAAHFPPTKEAAKKATKFTFHHKRSEDAIAAVENGFWLGRRQR